VNERVKLILLFLITVILVVWSGTGMVDVIELVSKSNTYAKACTNIDNNHNYAEVQPQAKIGKDWCSNITSEKVIIHASYAECVRLDNFAANLKLWMKKKGRKVISRK